MCGKVKEKREVEKLRKQGLSYNKILERIPVAKSSVSLWCNQIKLTEKQKEKIRQMQIKSRIINSQKGGKAIAEKRNKEIQEIKYFAKKEIKKLTKYQIKIIGTMIYWAEGSKTKGVEITNSDPELIKFMIYWLVNICNVPFPKLRAYLHIHANQNEEKAKKYWSRITKIPLNKFNKTWIKHGGTGHRKNILYNGLVKIRYNNEDLRHKIMAWIEEIYSKS
ncbi:hypothetical protein KKA23_00810 [Patescibacteria group bacterium]|nr:hypothetical protein [Patescibacteria group bacterium]MBU3923047.1 hypothetical protein [Patescibacteria group bacterium]